MITVLVALSGVIVLVFAIQRSMIDFQTSSIHMRDQANQINLKSYVKVKASCSKTFDAITSCNSSQVPLISTDDVELVSVARRSDYKKIGDYQLIAKCDEDANATTGQSNQKITVYFRHAKRAGDFKPLFSDGALCETEASS